MINDVFQVRKSEMLEMFQQSQHLNVFVRKLDKGTVFCEKFFRKFFCYLFDFPMYQSHTHMNFSVFLAHFRNILSTFFLELIIFNVQFILYEYQLSNHRVSKTSLHAYDLDRLLFTFYSSAN